jgi:hypothetical protein
MVRSLLDYRKARVVEEDESLNSLEGFWQWVIDAP